MSRSIVAETYEAADHSDDFYDFLTTFKRGDVFPYQRSIERQGQKRGRPLVIEYSDLYNYDPDLAIYLLRTPRKALKEFNEASDSTIRIRHLPEVTLLRSLDSEKIGSLLSVHGIVVKAGQDTSRVVTACYVCLNCHSHVLIDQPNQYLRKPLEKCESCERNQWELDLEKSTYKDAQTISIQDSPDQLEAGETPRKLEILLFDDLVKSANPGDLVDITGIISVRLAAPTSPRLELDRYLYASHVEVLNKEKAIMSLTDAERQEIIGISQEEDVADLIAASIAPSIYGHPEIKKAIALQLFGSPPVVKSDIRIRGDINILLVGDPSTAKSQLLRTTITLSSRGIYTTGGGASGVGLTAAVLKDKEGGYYLEAGALVLADQGICGIDEIDKMKEEDRGAIHPAMEQQIVNIAKGGIIASLNARTSILAAANPSQGRWNPYTTVAGNLSQFAISLLSRFDLIFIILDKPDEERDRLTGERIMQLEEQSSEALIDHKTLKRYIGYARSINPEIPTEIKQKIVDYYTRLRKSSSAEGEAVPIVIAARQLESLARLTKAHARLHLRDKVNAEDLVAAQSLFETSMKQVGVDPDTGSIDIDLLYTGKPRSMQAKLQRVLSTIAELERNGPVREDDLFKELEDDYKFDRAEAQRLVDTLMRDGTIFSPRLGSYKRTN